MSHRHVERVMGTAVGFDVRSDIDPTVIDRAVGWLHWVDQTFSTYRPDSAISRISAGKLTVEHAPPEVAEVLDRCEELRETTNEWFDPTPVGAGLPALDPSGYVKGWSIDRAGAILTAAGADAFCISAGGDVLTAGNPGPDGGWRVGIRHPHNAGAVAGILRVSGGAVATSGRYERGYHIWTRRSEPDIGILSATVTGPELGTADALATAVFASGGWDLDWFAGFPDYDLLVIDSRMRMLRSPSLEVLAA